LSNDRPPGGDSCLVFLPLGDVLVSLAAALVVVLVSP
jgi:hypothetical protein